MKMATAVSSFVVKRERRRKRKATELDQPRVVRQGFVFPEEEKEEEEKEKKKRKNNNNCTIEDQIEVNTDKQEEQTFVFNVNQYKDEEKKKKTPTKSSRHFNAEAISEAIRLKNEQSEKYKLRQKYLLKKKQEEEEETKRQEELALTLSPDQIQLYRLFHIQMKKEIRKTKKEFASSSARKDIIQLTEKCLLAAKEEFIQFLIENPPKSMKTSTKATNPENVRLAALLESKQARLDELEKEEARWLEIQQQIEAKEQQEEEEEEEEEAETNDVSTTENGENMDPQNTEQVLNVHSNDEKEQEEQKENSSEIEICRSELRVAQEIEQLQQQALKDIGLYADKLALLQDSMQTIDQLITKTEMKKSELVDSYQQSAFKGYNHFTNAKDALRSFTKLF